MENIRENKLTYTGDAGIVAWAQFPGDCRIKRIWGKDGQVVRDRGELKSQYALKYCKHVGKWPCVLYPSWSKAIFSGFFSEIEDVEDNSLHIMNCAQPIQLSKLGKNSVPPEAVLGPGIRENRGLRARVVVHYFGLEDVDLTWGVIPVNSDMLEYNVETCIQMLKYYKDSYNNKALEGMDMNMILNAMREAAIVLERQDLNPQSLINMYEFSSTSVLKNENIHKKVEQQENTPENFDDWDWGIGKNSQGYTAESQTQPFSQNLITGVSHK